MQHLEALLAAAQRSDKVVDYLFTVAPKGSTSQWDRLEMKVAPSTRVALDVAKSGGVRKAVTAMTVLTEAEAIDRYVRRDNRRAVRRAAAGNEAAAQHTREFLLDWAVRNDDQDVIGLLVTRIPPVAALGVLEGCGSHAERHVYSFTKLPEYAQADEIDRFLTCRFPEIAEAALRLVCARGDEQKLEDALAKAALSTEQKAEALWTTSGARTVAHFELVLVGGATKSRGGPARWERPSVLKMAESANKHMHAVAVNHQIDDELLDRLLVHNSPEVLTSLCERVRKPSHGERVARAVLELRKNPPPEPRNVHRYNAYRRTVHVPEAKNLIARRLVEGELLLDLLRTEDVMVTMEWIIDTNGGPKPGQFLALLENPGFAFTPLFGSEDGPATGLRAHEMLVAHLQVERLLADPASPAVTEIIENTRGLVKNWTTKSRSLRNFSSYLLDRLYESFGNDDESLRLWEMWCKMASAHVGTIQELILTVAAAYGVPLRNSTPAEPAPEAGVAIQGKLF